MHTRNLIRLLIVAALSIASGLSGPALSQAISPAAGQQPRQPAEPAGPGIANATSPVPRASTGVSMYSGSRGRSGYGVVQNGLFMIPSGNAVLLVPSGQPQQERILSLNEDLTVMCRIFDRLLSQAGLNGQTRIAYGFLMGGADGWLSSFFSNSGGPVECLYIEGYGPVFLMSVEFPLVAPPQEDSQADANEPADPLWNQVRQETYAPQTRGGSRDAGGRSPYSAEKVRLLKETLVRALKHAANIRGLDEDAWLTVTVRGPGATAGGTTAWIGPGLRSGDLYGEMMAPASPPPTAILTIRASIRDVSALASGELESDEFAGRIEITEQ